MDRDVPGITVSAAGITGARARFLDKQDDTHFAQLLSNAKPDLIALAFGSNEITDGMLYPLERSFFFIHKPATFIRYADVATVEGKKGRDDGLFAQAKAALPV